MALIAGLVTRQPRTRGLVAFFVPLLAPYWGMRERMRGRSVVWLVALVVYVGARVTPSTSSRNEGALCFALTA